MTRATWKILQRGRVQLDAPMVPYDCPRCGYEALLPILGMPLAQLSEGGIVFDTGDHAMPAEIQCRHCRRRFEST